MAAVAYHFSAKTISRAKGQSACASVSYIIAEKVNDERLGKVFDYTRKQGVEFVYHAAPKNAPEWAHSIETAWNKAEEVENRSNSTIARGYDAAFPHQLDERQREYVLKDFIREEFTRKGFMATAAIHSPDKNGDERNYHTHVIFSERAISADGFAANKDRRFTAYTMREETLENLKEKWAELGARQLERASFQTEADRWRHGYKTLDEQRTAALERGDNDYAKECEREASKHKGADVCAMERDGKETDRGNEARDIEARNAQLNQLKMEAAIIALEIAREEMTQEPDLINREAANQNFMDTDDERLKKGNNSDHERATYGSRASMVAQQEAANEDFKNRQAELERRFQAKQASESAPVFQKENDLAKARAAPDPLQAYADERIDQKLEPEKTNEQPSLDKQEPHANERPFSSGAVWDLPDPKDPAHWSSEKLAASNKQIDEKLEQTQNAVPFPVFGLGEKVWQAAHKFEQERLEQQAQKEQAAAVKTAETIAERVDEPKPEPTQAKEKMATHEPTQSDIERGSSVELQADKIAEHEQSHDDGFSEHEKRQNDFEDFQKREENLEPSAKYDREAITKQFGAIIPNGGKDLDEEGWKIWEDRYDKFTADKSHERAGASHDRIHTRNDRER